MLRCGPDEDTLATSPWVVATCAQVMPGSARRRPNRDRARSKGHSHVREFVHGAQASPLNWPPVCGPSAESAPNSTLLEGGLLRGRVLHPDSAINRQRQDKNRTSQQPEVTAVFFEFRELESNRLTLRGDIRAGGRERTPSGHTLRPPCRRGRQRVSVGHTAERNSRRPTSRAVWRSPVARGERTEPTERDSSARASGASRAHGARGRGLVRAQ